MRVSVLGKASTIGLCGVMFLACGEGDPESVKRMNEGIGAAQSGDLMTASDHLKMAAQIDPTNDRALQILGMVHSQMGKFPDARDDFQRAIAADGENALYREQFAEAVIKIAKKKEEDDHKVRATSEWDEAKKELEKAVQLDPKRFRSYFLLGNVNEALQDPQSALENYTKAIQEGPRFLDAYQFLGRLYAALEYPKEAKAVITEGLKVALPATEEEAGLYNLLGGVSLGEAEVLDEAGQNAKYQEAVVAFKKALDVVPSKADTLFSMAVTQEAMGNKEEAVRYYKKFSSVGKTAPEVHQRRAREKISELSAT